MFFIRTNHKYKDSNGTFCENKLINLDLAESVYPTANRYYFQICFEMSCGKDRYWRFDFPEPRNVAFADIKKKLFGE